MNIMFDLDGVLFDFTEGFVSWHNDRYEPKIDPNWNTYDFGIGKPIVERIFQFGMDGGYSRLNPLPNVVEGFNRLAKDNNIHVITNTPPVLLQQRVTRMSEKGFHTHLVKSFNCVRGKDKKCRELGIELAFEDCATHVEKLVDTGITVMVPITQYNLNIQRTERVIYYRNLNQVSLDILALENVSDLHKLYNKEIDL